MSGIEKRASWTIDRCEQLKQLESLLRHAGSINSSSGCVERIQECIKIANDLRSGRDLELSFFEFLQVDSMQSSPDLLAANAQLRARVVLLESELMRLGVMNWNAGEQ